MRKIFDPVGSNFQFSTLFTQTIQQTIYENEFDIIHYCSYSELFLLHCCACLALGAAVLLLLALSSFFLCFLDGRRPALGFLALAHEQALGAHHLHGGNLVV